ncbi:hypothetical protein KHA90_08975 [Flavobacterium psychroterrae]|uniref:DUF4738 domain-containing protein n=1 Tax=Flavobacterium psychroterrae TaxID=2133767 RepID=A0ABS5PA16_9FLAO|nr:hypothetical protein [Flavobacterium psychroterrae]MBS7231157.1 hypothetical protein [Flavobacterium psychroterrae]
MKRILGITFLALLFINCKENKKQSDNNKDLDSLSTELVKDSLNESVAGTKKVISNNDNNSADYWIFYKISESSISGTATKTKTEIADQFKNIKISIDDKKLKVDGICTFEYYKSNKTPVKYYESSKTAKSYESIFLKNGIKLGNEITVYQSMYPDKVCELPWDEVLIIDNVIVVVYDDYLVFFKKGNNINEGDCYIQTKITNLPITKKIINGNNIWNQLDCTVANLESKDYLRLPDIKEIKVFIIGNFNYDDFTYTLITLKNNKVISKKDIGFVKESTENTVSEFTEFEIDKDYVFSLNTKSKKGDDFKTIKLEKFKINDDGLIEVAK